MQATFHQLGQIVLNGLPTFFLILFLNFYLKRMFFTPLEQTLAQRYEKTEGARISADESLKAADRRIAEYQAALRNARGEVYADQEAAHRKLSDEQALATLEQAKKHADALVATEQVAIGRGQGSLFWRLWRGGVMCWLSRLRNPF